MKVGIKCLISVCLLLVIVGCSGCLFTLNKPILHLNDGSFELYWQAQKSVKHYEVNLNDEIFVVETNKFDLAPVLGTGIQNVKVRAVSDNMFTNDSGWSDDYTLVMGETRLDTPEVVGLPNEANGYTLSWNNVENAGLYVVGIKPNVGQEQFFCTTKNNIGVLTYMTNGGKYNLRVRALSYDYANYAPSEYCDIIEYECPLPLEQPVNVVVTDNVLSWDAVANADGYRVTDMDGLSMETETTTLNISSMIEDYQVEYFFVQAISNGDTQDSAYSDAVGVYPRSTSPTTQKQAYADCQLDFMGVEFDLVVDSTAEMRLVCYFALYYRITNMEIYVNYNTNVSNELLTYLSEYNEIKSISYGLQGPIIYSPDSRYVVNIVYNHVAMPVKSATGDRNSAQVENLKPINYTKVEDDDVHKRGADFDDFAINNREKEILVFNTDQLYYALQNDCKPKFPSTTCMAYKAYDKAKSILREIIDNGMTEYEKMLAIYEWVVYNSHYDFNLLDLSSELENNIDEAVRHSASAVLSNYKGFYIEGVLFDNGQAVCDGIAKTVVLLANIEDIKCIKVSGDAGGAHAWNKVYLQVPGQTEKKWFTIDATWADVVDSKNQEWLSHRYFLKTDAELTNHTEDPSSGYSSITQFDYYANTVIGEFDGTGVDLDIANVNELTNLFNYILEWNELNTDIISGIEFKYNTSMSSTIRSTIGSILGGIEHLIVQSGNICFVVFQ